MTNFVEFWQTRWRAIVYIAATYFYFLIFAQFGFLHRIEETLSADAWDFVLGAMALAGVAGALWTAFKFRSEDGERWMLVGLVGCCCGALCALIGTHLVVFVLSSVMTGFFLALLTTSLIGVLAVRFPVRQIGLACGFGTGLAYLMSNVPRIFEASASGHCWFGLLSCVLGIVVLCCRDKALVSDHSSLTMGSGVGWTVLIGQMLVFLVLVWLDSAAFTEIQQSAELKAVSWSGTVNLWAIGCVHFGAAVLGGWLMDRGRFAWLGVLTLLGLCGGFLLLKDGSLGGLDPTLLYVASVSLYSTALVAFALVQGSFLSAVRRAGLVFAVAGWMGSAMGIGMVNDLGALPNVFWGIAGAVLLCGLWLTRKRVAV